MAKSLYDTLGVSKSSSADEIKKAYRKLARQYHPDRNPDDTKAEERFKEVQTAYDVLSDPDKRKQYDTFGSVNGRPAPGGAGSGGMAGDFGDFDFGNLGDLFGGLFGGRGRARRREAEKGADLQTEVRLSFEDSLKGVETRIPVESATACRVCSGSGAKPGTAPRICPECNGRGVVSESQGLFALSQPCQRCRGNGTVIDEPCVNCHGSGRERRTRRLAVKIPAGVRDGTRIRLKAKGEPGTNGGPAGDLYVVTRVEPSSVYERRGDDLLVDVPVTYAEAALGASVDVPTPDGQISMKVPAGSQPGKLLKVRGRGAPRIKGSGRGDLLARLRVTVPTKLTKAERQALEDLHKVSREQPRDEVSR